MIPAKTQKKNYIFFCNRLPGTVFKPLGKMAVCDARPLSQIKTTHARLNRAKIDVQRGKNA